MITFKEFLLLLIGAFLGLISSFLTTIFNRSLDKLGRLRIYHKVVNLKFSNETWGFFRNSGGTYFQIPIWLEFQNNSDVPKIIRDVNIYLYKSGMKLCNMAQINFQDVNNERIYYGDEGVYSFSVGPRSIKKVDLLFSIKQKDFELQTGCNDFDEIRISFFGSKNKERVYKLLSIDQCWKIGELPRKNEWAKLR